MRFLLPAAAVIAISAHECQAFGSSNPTAPRKQLQQRCALYVASKEVLNQAQEEQKAVDPSDDDQKVADVVSAVLNSENQDVMEEFEAEDDDEDLEAMDEGTFLERTKLLCQQRNFRLEKVKNARDLASTPNSPIQHGRLYRTGRLSDATPNDIQLLFQELGLKTLVDLRSPTELKDDSTLLRNEVFGDFTNVVWMERGRGKDGCLKVLPAGQSPVKTKKRAGLSNNRPRNFWRRHFGKKQQEEVLVQLETKDEGDDESEEEDDDDEVVTLNFLPEEECGIDDCPDPTESLLPAQGKERHFVSLMNEFKYVRGALSKVRKRDIARTLLKSPGALVSRRVRTSCKKPFIKEINDGGLHMLNELLLRFGAPGIKYVLELCADSSRHPVAFYCTAGKDRTGMIAAIILGLCGVPAKDIVEDYTLSANVYAEMNDHSAMVGALSQRSLDPKTFLGAPPHVMRETLEAINTEYGSVEGYCNWIGFGPEKQEKLRKALLL